MNKQRQKLVLDKALLLIIIRYFLKLDKDFESKLLNMLAEKAEIKNVLSGKELRMIWLYQMNHGELYCSICGNKIEKDSGKCRKLTRDHVVPKSKGGSINASNIMPAHSICNTAKSNFSVEEWEKVGKNILELYGIKINELHSIYDYRGK